jgi:hypothetical protein
MKIRALGILEPPGFDRRVMPGEKADVPDDYGARVCNDQLAVAVAVKPSRRAETRPAPGGVETRHRG